MTQPEFEAAKELWKLAYADNAFEQAMHCIHFILENNLDINDPLYDALTVTIFTSYGRPFTNNHGIGKLSVEMLSPPQLIFHDQNMKTFRDQIYAHSDTQANVSADHGPILQVRGEVEAGKPLKVSTTNLKLQPGHFKLLAGYILSVHELIHEKIRLWLTQNRVHNPSTAGECVLNIYDVSKPMWITLADAKQVTPPNSTLLNVIDLPKG
jgi:hypothetical protein